MALRQYRPEDYQYEEYIPKEKQVQYRAYQRQYPQNERLNEFLFFANIALFSIITVLATYAYLSFKIPTLLAFIMAIVTGLIGLRGIQFFIKKQLRQSKRR